MPELGHLVQNWERAKVVASPGRVIVADDAPTSAERKTATMSESKTKAPAKKKAVSVQSIVDRERKRAVEIVEKCMATMEKHGGAAYADMVRTAVREIKG